MSNTDIIKAIETEYGGHRFRSRLEARWAVFFDALGIRYSYEPEGFSLKYGIKYLPDFALYNVHWRGERAEYYTGKVGHPIFVEIKGAETYDDIPTNEQIKIEEFSKSRPLLVLGNIPNDVYSAMCEHMNDGIMNYRFLDGDQYSCFFSVFNKKIWLCGSDHEEYNPKSVERALLIAKMARFEYGEKPNALQEDNHSPFN